MTETLLKAWALFDAGNYTDAETIYKECYAKIPSTDHDNYFSRMTHLPAPQISTSRAMFPSSIKIFLTHKKTSIHP